MLQENHFLVSQIAEVIKHIREVRKDVIIFVDNCYGEFIETIEPTDLVQILWLVHL